MFTDYDINDCLKNVCQDDNKDRLLWFARIRNYMLKSSSTDIQLGIRLIIIRFKKECLATPPIAHWLLDILQMCVLHCTQEFLVALNDKEVLETFREVLTNRYDEVVCLKLSTLVKSWHEQFNFPYPDSDFNRTCEVESTREKPTNLHWFPNRNIMNQQLDSVSYDLEAVRNYLIDHSNTQLSNLNAFYADHYSSTVAKEKDPEKQAKMTLEVVKADLRLWEDIVQHTGLPDESLQGLRKVQTDVQQIVRNLKKKPGTVSSRTGDHGSALQIDAFQFEGGNRGPERQSAQPTASGFSSRAGGQRYVMQVQTQPPSSLQQSTGEVRTSVHQSEPPIDTKGTSAGKLAFSIVQDTFANAETTNALGGQQKGNNEKIDTNGRSAGNHAYSSLQTNVPTNSRNGQSRGIYENTAGSVSPRPGEQGYGGKGATLPQSSHYPPTGGYRNSPPPSTPPNPAKRTSTASPRSGISQQPAFATGPQVNSINARNESQWESSRPNHPSASGASVPHSTQPEGQQTANRDLQKWMCSLRQCEFQKGDDYITHISTEEHLQLESNISKRIPASPDSVTHSPQPQARQRANRDQQRWMCSVCKCDFQEEKDYIDHLSTEEHLQLESRESVLRSTQPEDCQRVNRDQHKWMCSICQCEFQDEEEYIQHLSSKKHESKSSKHPSTSRDSVPLATHKWVCSICQREFQHENDYTTHITSKKHESMSSKRKWMCSICQHEFQHENDYTTHITSKKHIAKEQASTANPASSVPQKEALAPGLREHLTNAPSSQPKGDYEESQLESNTSKHSSTSSASVPPSTKHEGRQGANGAQCKWMCPICRIGFHEKEDYIGHLSSDEHKQAVAALPHLPTE